MSAAAAGHVPSHYEVLGLHPQATARQVRTRYRRLALIHHPDKGGDETAFRRITGAAECLLDERARREYDDALRGARGAHFFYSSPQQQQRGRRSAGDGPAPGSEEESGREGRDRWQWSGAWEDLEEAFEKMNLRKNARPYADVGVEWGADGKKSRFRRPSRERIWVHY